MRQFLQGQATLQVPEPEDGIISAAGEQTSIGGKGHA